MFIGLSKICLIYKDSVLQKNNVKAEIKVSEMEFVPGNEQLSSNRDSIRGLLGDVKITAHRHVRQLKIYGRPYL